MLCIRQSTGHGQVPCTAHRSNADNQVSWVAKGRERVERKGEGRKEGRREGRKEGGKEGGREERKSEGREEGGREANDRISSKRHLSILILILILISLPLLFYSPFLTTLNPLYHPVIKHWTTLTDPVKSKSTVTANWVCPPCAARIRLISITGGALDELVSPSLTRWVMGYG